MRIMSRLNKTVTDTLYIMLYFHFYSVAPTDADHVAELERKVQEKDTVSILTSFTGITKYCLGTYQCFFRTFRKV